MTALKRRSAGILLHPTSLPGRYGIGDLGPLAYAWVEALARAKQTWWQILPLGPTGYGDSPYQSYSAFAGNPNLVSPDLLDRVGLVAGSDLENVHFPTDHVDYDNVTKFKDWLLDRAWQGFRGGAAGQLRPDFERFQREEAYWLDDFALFMAVKAAQGGGSWQEWPADLKRREPAALGRARKELDYAVGLHRFRQFLFFRQWRARREDAHRRGAQVFRGGPHLRFAGSVRVCVPPGLLPP